MVDPEFEYERMADGKRRLISLDDVVYRLLRHTGRLTSTDSQLLLRERYDTMFGLFNHDSQAENAKQPFALVAIHPGEDNLVSSLLYERIRLFRILEVHKHYGLSLKDFFDLPPYITEEILAQCAKEKNAGDDATRKAMERMRQEGLLK